jgi:hypothetical protein
MTRNNILQRGVMAICLCCLLFLTSESAFAADLGQCNDLLRGSDTSGATNTELSLGSVTADAARAFGQADVALLPSEDFGSNLQPGGVTEEDLAQCLQRNSTLAVVEMTARQLCQELEWGFSFVTLDPAETIDQEDSYFPGYLQLSGLRVTYDATAPAGERIYSIELEDGTPVDQEDETARYRVVSTQALLLGEYGYPAFDEQSLTLLGTEQQAFAAYLQSQGSVGEPDSRVTIYGTRDETVRQWLILLALLICGVLLLARLTGRTPKERDVWHTSRTADAEEVAAYERARLAQFQSSEEATER